MKLEFGKWVKIDGYIGKIICFGEMGMYTVTLARDDEDGCCIFNSKNSNYIVANNEEDLMEETK